MSVASLANRTVVVERYAATQDNWGSPARAFTFHLRSSGRLQPLSGADIIRHSKDEMRVTHKLYVSGTPDIEAGDRLTVNKKTLYVQTVRNIDEADKFLTIECEERDA